MRAVFKRLGILMVSLIATLSLSCTAFASDDDEVVGNKYSIAVSASTTCGAYTNGVVVAHPKKAKKAYEKFVNSTVKVRKKQMETKYARKIKVLQFV